ncbi:glycosyltransferase [uncultured Chitinophaga sp.]|uniref:glycosyltransferase n=1 Tax=uncultured Chitinophaga sp. TaxID=339340 RepID=UPI0025D42B10|nr:glycosyltransferase [uncultured Chitinophaga sp.]
MRIVILASGLVADSPADTGHVYWDFLYALSNQRPDDQFVLVLDKPYHKKFPLPANVTLVEKNVGTAYISWWWFRNYTWPSLIKKYQADQVMVVDDVLPLKAGVPAWLLLFHNKKAVAGGDAKKFLGNYKGIFTVSDYLKQAVVDKFPAFEAGIKVLPPGNLSAIRPVQWEDREEFKREFTGGVEYFAAVGTFHPDNNIMPLLKAFSKLKGRLHSNIKLVIAGRATAAGNAIAESLASYRFRDDVVWIKDANVHQLSRLIASAYGLVHVATVEGVALPILAAQRAEVPVVAFDTDVAREAGGDAALYAEADDITGLAEQMGALYKDEMLRNRLLANIPPLPENASWDGFAASVWQVITQ